jgi:hypothetical protein
MLYMTVYKLEQSLANAFRRGMSLTASAS